MNLSKDRVWVFFWALLGLFWDHFGRILVIVFVCFFNIFENPQNIKIGQPSHSLGLFLSYPWDLFWSCFGHPFRLLFGSFLHDLFKASWGLLGASWGLLRATWSPLRTQRPEGREYEAGGWGQRRQPGAGSGPRERPGTSPAIFFGGLGLE